jgi:hypothetical protein
MKTQLEIGDKIQRFEVNLTKEIPYITEIISVTKTLAKTESKTFNRGLIFDVAKPKNATNKIIVGVYSKGKRDWSTPSYFLIEEL